MGRQRKLVPDVLRSEPFAATTTAVDTPTRVLGVASPALTGMGREIAAECGEHKPHQTAAFWRGTDVGWAQKVRHYYHLTM